LQIQKYVISIPSNPGLRWKIPVRMGQYDELHLVIASFSIKSVRFS